MGTMVLKNIVAIGKSMGTMVLKNIVNRVSIMALAMVLCAAGSSAAAGSKNPRPVVVSTNPIDGAVNVDVRTKITVNFSLPMKCGSINEKTFSVTHAGSPCIATRTYASSSSTGIFNH